MSGTTVKPFLMFQGQAREAMTFYLSLFPDARVISAEHYGPGEPGLPPDQRNELRNARNDGVSREVPLEVTKVGRDARLEHAAFAALGALGRASLDFELHGFGNVSERGPRL